MHTQTQKQSLWPPILQSHLSSKPPVDTESVPANPLGEGLCNNAHEFGHITEPFQNISSCYSSVNWSNVSCFRKPHHQFGIGSIMFLKTRGV